MTRKEVLALASIGVVGYVAGTLTPLVPVAALIAPRAPAPPPALPEAVYHGVSLRVLRFWTDARAGAPSDAPEADTTYYLVRVLLTHHGSGTYAYSDSSFRLQAPDGLAYQHTTAIADINTLLAGEDRLGPGQRIAGDVVFEAPLHQVFVLLWQPTSVAVSLVLPLPLL